MKAIYHESVGTELKVRNYWDHEIALRTHQGGYNKKR